MLNGKWSEVLVLPEWHMWHVLPTSPTPKGIHPKVPFRCSTRNSSPLNLLTRLGALWPFTNMMRSCSTSDFDATRQPIGKKGLNLSSQVVATLLSLAIHPKHFALWQSTCLWRASGSFSKQSIAWFNVAQLVHSDSAFQNQTLDIMKVTSAPELPTLVLLFMV